MGLKTVANFFDILNRKGIRYCHWKSNIRLELAKRGETDLDILVLQDDSSTFKAILKDLKFIKLHSHALKSVPDIEDYLGFDNDTGRLIHIHVHYKLILGHRYIKNHHLPVESLFLENCYFCDNVRIPVPEIEFIILYLRAFLKLGILSLLKHLIKDVLGESYIPFPRDIEEEFDQLLKECEIERTVSIWHRLNLPLSEEAFSTFISKFRNRRLRCWEVISMKRNVTIGLRPFRRRKGPSLLIKSIVLHTLNSRLLGQANGLLKKRMSKRGKFIAFVGADGSGKTTISSVISEWLGWKLAVKKVYFGMPKNFCVRLVHFIALGLKRLGLAALSEFVYSLVWVWVARKRLASSKKCWGFTGKGGIVIADRFPLKEFWSMREPMDGPRINGRLNRVNSALDRLEKAYYNKIKLPDQILVLRVNYENLRYRKSDLSPSLQLEKMKAVNSLPELAPFALINANKSLEDVILEVKRNIWDIL